MTGQVWYDVFEAGESCCRVQIAFPIPGERYAQKSSGILFLTKETEFLNWPVFSVIPAQAGIQIKLYAVSCPVQRHSCTGGVTAPSSGALEQLIPSSPSAVVGDPVVYRQ